MNEAINLKEKFKLFSDLWSPKRIGKLNGQQILLAKIKGEFVFHKHDDEDELFLVMKGQLELVLEDKTIVLNKGEFFIVPKGVLHKPIAREETHLLLFEINLYYLKNQILNNYLIYLLRPIISYKFIFFF